MDLMVEHLLVEVHRCLSSFFPTRFSGWPTSYAAGMMPPYGAQGELRRITLPRTPVNKGKKKGRGVVPRPAVRLVEPVYPLAVARDHVRIVGEHFIVPAPAGDAVFPRRIVDG